MGARDSVRSAVPAAVRAAVATTATDAVGRYGQVENDICEVPRDGCVDVARTALATVTVLCKLDARLCKAPSLPPANPFGNVSGARRQTTFGPVGAVVERGARVGAVGRHVDRADIPKEGARRVNVCPLHVLPIANLPACAVRRRGSRVPKSSKADPRVDIRRLVVSEAALAGPRQCAARVVSIAPELAVHTLRLRAAAQSRNRKQDREHSGGQQHTRSLSTAPQFHRTT